MAKEILIIVDKKDNIIGKETREKCHSIDGLLHRAIATFIFNDKNELLITQRSKSKKLWPNFWDASCCTHVYPNETYERAGERRLSQELGFFSKLKLLFKFRYQAKYKNIGSENEFCGLLVGRYNKSVRPNPKEISDYKWVKLEKLKNDINKHPEKYTPWLKIALKEFIQKYKFEDIFIEDFNLETAREVDRFTIDYLNKLKEQDKNFPHTLVSHLPLLRMSPEGIQKMRAPIGRLTYELISERKNWKEILPILAGTEIYAISTYVLDDIFDNQPVRQNDLATWKKYGISNAIIAGILQRDITIKLLFELKISEEKLLEIIRLYEEADYKLYIGQALNEEMKRGTKLEDYIKIRSLLTSEFPAMIVSIGIICNLKKEKLKLLQELGQKLGILALMRNDFMSYVPEEIKEKGQTIAMKGKTFEDARKGLWTFPIIDFLTNPEISNQEKQKVLNVLEKEEVTEEEIKDLIRLLIKYKSFDRFRDFMNFYEKEIEKIIRKTG